MRLVSQKPVRRKAQSFGYTIKNAVIAISFSAKNKWICSCLRLQYRTLTLEPFVRGELLKHREKQEHMKKVMCSAYSKEYTDYVCVDALGKLYDPDFVTGHFGQLLKKHKLKKIRFHDLRHSCASVLLAQGVPMKQIQEWFGHSDMSTTANIYSHLDAVTKADTGAAMSKALG